MLAGEEELEKVEKLLPVQSDEGRTSIQRDEGGRAKELADRRASVVVVRSKEGMAVEVILRSNRAFARAREPFVALLPRQSVDWR